MRKYRLGPRLDAVTASIPVSPVTNPDGSTPPPAPVLKSYPEILARFLKIEPVDGGLNARIQVTIPPYSLATYHELVAVHAVAVLDGHNEPDQPEDFVNSFFPKAAIAVSGETSGSVRDIVIPSLTVDATYRIRTILECEVADEPPAESPPPGMVATLEFKANAVIDTQPPAA